MTKNTTDDNDASKCINIKNLFSEVNLFQNIIINTGIWKCDYLAIHSTNKVNKG